MAFFESKSSRTIFSPKNELLEPLYTLIEKYDSTLAGCRFYEDLIETYEYLDFVINKDSEEGSITYHAWTCLTGCGHTSLMDKFVKGKRVYCANCGTKSEMVYIGETTLSNEPKNKNQGGFLK